MRIGLSREELCRWFMQGYEEVIDHASAREGLPGWRKTTDQEGWKDGLGGMGGAG